MQIFILNYSRSSPNQISQFIPQMVAKYLNISIKDAAESLKDGVILCQLLNEMKKNAVRKIMMPQGEEKLSTMKSTVNLNSFLRFVQINIGKVGVR